MDKNAWHIQLVTTTRAGWKGIPPENSCVFLWRLFVLAFMTCWYAFVFITMAMLPLCHILKGINTGDWKPQEEFHVIMLVVEILWVMGVMVCLMIGCVYLMWHTLLMTLETLAWLWYCIDHVTDANVKILWLWDKICKPMTYDG